MNKKGTIEDGLFWILRIAMIIIVVSLVIFFINSVISKQLDTKDLEAHLIAARIINSPECLALKKSIDIYEEKSDNVIRVYPGIIDISKYDEEFLKKNCVIDEGKADIGIKITIKGLESKYINKDYYDDIEPLTFSPKYLKVRKVFPVIILETNGKKISKTIEIIVVEKKR